MKNPVFFGADTIRKCQKGEYCAVYTNRCWLRNRDQKCTRVAFTMTPQEWLFLILARYQF